MRYLILAMIIMTVGSVVLWARSAWRDPDDDPEEETLAEILPDDDTEIILGREIIPELAEDPDPDILCQLAAADARRCWEITHLELPALRLQLELGLMAAGMPPS